MTTAPKGKAKSNDKNVTPAESPRYNAHIVATKTRRATVKAPNILSNSKAVLKSG